MRDVELKYNIIEKKAYGLIQALKSFRMYVLHSPITAYVPNSAVKIVLTQRDTDGKRGRWITQILEFDLTIKTTKLVKGQGLAKILTESNCKVLGINSILEIQGENPQEPLPSDQINPLHIDEKFLLSDWYQDIVNFLIHFECLASFSKSQCKILKLKVINYYIINLNLYWKDTLNIFLLCLIES